VTVKHSKIGLLGSLKHKKTIGDRSPDSSVQGMNGDWVEEENRGKGLALSNVMRWTRMCSQTGRE